MDILSLNSLDEFSPEHYVAILSQVAHSDGLDAEEQAILEQYASRFDVDLNALPDVPVDLSNHFLEHAHPGLSGCLHACVGRWIGFFG